MYSPTHLGLLEFSCLEKGSTEQICENEYVGLLNKLQKNSYGHWRLFPLIRENAKQFGIFSKVSESVQSQLNQESKRGIVRELAKEQQLNNVIDTLGKHNIKIILLKSSAFAKYLYSPQVPRLCNDIDILVKEKDWHDAIHALDSLMTYKEKRFPGILADSSQISYVPKQKVGAALDLHCSLIQKELFNISEVELWNHSVMHSCYSNENIRMLSPECMYIHQAIHAYKDLEFVKYNVVDCNKLLKKEKIDKGLLIELAKKFEVENIVFFMWYCHEEIFNNISSGPDLSELMPSKSRLWAMKLLLKYGKRETQGRKRTIGYRFTQVISQYVFSSKVLPVVKFQLSYLKELIISRVFKAKVKRFETI